MNSKLDLEKGLLVPVEALPALAKKIAWICYLMRGIALLLCGWSLWHILSRWTDKNQVVQAYGRWFKLDLSNLTTSQYLLGFALIIGLWIGFAFLCLKLWALTAGYLQGHILTSQAADNLWFLGLGGLLLLIADLLARPLLSLILGGKLGGGLGGSFVGLMPRDLELAMLLVGLMALAQILRSAARLARDHAQIV